LTYRTFSAVSPYQNLHSKKHRVTFLAVEDGYYILCVSTKQKLMDDPIERKKKEKKKE